MIAQDSMTTAAARARIEHRARVMAYHESGHAVTGLALGIVVRSAKIERDSGSEVVRGEVFLGLDETRRGETGRHLLLLLAGGGAVERAGIDENPWAGTGNDLRQFEQKARPLAAAEGVEYEDILGACCQFTRALIERHWAAIDRVADKLYLHRHLSGHAIEVFAKVQPGQAWAEIERLADEYAAVPGDRRDGALAEDDARSWDAAMAVLAYEDDATRRGRER